MSGFSVAIVWAIKAAVIVGLPLTAALLWAAFREGQYLGRAPSQSVTVEGIALRQLSHMEEQLSAASQEIKRLNDELATLQAGHGSAISIAELESAVVSELRQDLSERSALSNEQVIQRVAAVFEEEAAARV